MRATSGTSPSRSSAPPRRWRDRRAYAVLRVSPRAAPAGSGWAPPSAGGGAGTPFSVFPVGGLVVAKGMRAVFPACGPASAGQPQVFGDGPSHELPGGRVGQVLGG